MNFIKNIFKFRQVLKTQSGVMGNQNPSACEAPDGIEKNKPMPQNNTKYHTGLAEYFARKALYLDIPTQKKPNTRKLVEQPWQQTKGKMLYNVTDTLCDLSFIQAKCQAGLTYVLVRDYDYAITTFMTDAGSVTNIQEDWRVLKTFSNDLMEYAQSNAWVGGIHHYTYKTLPTLKSLIKVAGELENKDDKSSGISRLIEFGQFVKVSSPLLNEFCLIPGFLVQHIYNSMNSGVIANLAEQVISNLEFQSPVLIRAEVSRHNYEEKPALILKLLENEGISSLTMTADGTRIITGDGNGTIRIWNARTGECEKIVQLTSQFYHVQGLAISSDARIAVTVPDSSDKVLRIWNLMTGYQSDVSPLSGHEKGINTISITPDGSLLASGGNDGTVRLWDVIKGTCIRILNAGNNVNSVQISPDGRLVTALAKDEIIVWNAEKGEIVDRTKLGSSFSKFVMSLDGKITMISEMNRIAIWSVDNKTLQQLCELPKDVYVNSMAITPDGAIAICGSSDHMVRIFDVYKRTEVRNYRGHSQRVLAVALRADGKYAVSTGTDGLICVWDTACLSTPPIPVELQGKVNSLAIVRKQKLALCQRDDGKMRFYQLDSGKDMTFFDSTNFISWAINPDGRFCFSKIEQGIEGWDMVTGLKHQFLSEETPKEANADMYPILTLMNVRVAAKGNRAISPGNDRIWIWDLTNGMCTGGLAVPGELCAMDISSDGRLAVAAGWINTRNSDYDIRLWNLDTGQLLHIFPMEASVKALLFNPDCRSLIGGSSDGMLKIWHTSTGKLIKTIGEKLSFLHANKSLDIQRLLVIQSGRKVLILGSSSITICDLQSGSIGQSLNAGVKSNNGLVAEISEDGCYAFTGTSGHSIRVWDINANQCVMVNAENSEIVHLNSADNQIVIINIDGEALFATLKNVTFGPAILTALSRSSQPCPFCNAVINTPQHIIEKISHFENSVASGISPSMELSYEAWCDTGLLEKCESCGHTLRFNPFFASSDLKFK